MTTSNYCDLYCKACGSELFLNKDKHAESSIQWAIDNFKRRHAVTCGKNTVKMGLKPVKEVHDEHN